MTTDAGRKLFAETRTNKPTVEASPAASSGLERGAAMYAARHRRDTREPDRPDTVEAVDTRPTA